MRFATSALFLSAIVTFASASPSKLRALTTNTEAGKNLMEKARLLQEEEGQSQGSQDQGNYDYKNWYANKRASNQRTQANWLLDYNIKFEGCSAEYVAARDGMQRQLLANFRLCPATGTCAFCTQGGEYIVDMETFVQSYKDIAMNDKACRYQQEKCYEQCLESDRYQTQNNYVSDEYDNGDYSGYNAAQNYEDRRYCQQDCMNDAGMAYCDSRADQNGGQGYNWQWNVEAMVQCRQLDYYGSNSQPYWVGATCRNGGVYLDTFTDMECTHAAPSGTFEELTGETLPKQNLVNSDCIACNGYNTYQRYQEYQAYENYQNYQNNKQEYQNGNEQNQENQNNQNQDPEYEFNEYENVYQGAGVCSQLYQTAGKCEKHMSGSLFKDTSGCDYIKRMKRGSSLSIVTKFFGWFLLFTGIGAAGIMLYNKMFARRASSPAMKSLDEPLAPPANEEATVVDDASSYQGGAMPAETQVPEFKVKKLDDSNAI